MRLISVREVMQVSDFKIVTFYYDDRTGSLKAIYDDNYLRLRKDKLIQLLQDIICEIEDFKLMLDINEANKK